MDELKMKISSLEKEIKEKDEIYSKKITELENDKINLTNNEKDLNIMINKLNEIIQYHQESTVDITYIKNIIINYFKENDEESFNIICSVLV